MVKKIFFVLALMGFLPMGSAFADEAFSADEITQMENQWDLETEIKYGSSTPMARVERDKGKELAIGIIGAVVDNINGRGRGRGRGDDGGWGRGGRDDDRWGRGRDDRRRPSRQIQCVAQNRFGQRFQSVGYDMERVQRRVLYTCEQESSRFDRRGRGGQCRVISCRGVR